MFAQAAEPLKGPQEANTVPMLCAHLGSWQISIRRDGYSASELAEHYDRAAPSWGQTAQRYQLVERYSAALAQSRIPERLSRAGQSPHVLDCGIGTGALTLASQGLLPRKAAFCGIDTSASMLNVADATLRGSGISPSLHQAEIQDMPFQEGTFDLVMAAHVLEHLPDPLGGLREMVRVLKPGGHLFLCITKPSLFGAFIQTRWRTWAVSNRQGVQWLRACGLSHLGLCPVGLGARAGQASTAFWARKQTI
ncbi:MAG: class I SAM-dependent methyltransferase [Pseudomonadota bacterium]